MKEVRIGSRESKLAVIQSEMVMDSIRTYHKDMQVSLITMKTTGDKILDRTLDKIGGKGLFVKELDHALLQGKTNLSVHSLKDMPMEIPKELPIVGFSKREDPRDVLVLPKGETALDASLPIGCASARRIVQLQELYPGCICKPVRGNVLTRLNKLDNHEYGALVLAAAGLKRLGLSDRISRYFEPEEMIPAAGQGILALQGRNDESYEYIQEFINEDGRTAALCERAFVRTLDGGCSSPIAAHAIIEKEDTIRLLGLYYDETHKQIYKGELRGRKERAEQLGTELALQLKKQAEERNKEHDR